MALVEYDAVTDYANLSVTLNLAVLYIAACNRACAGDLEHLTNLCVAENNFLELRLEHALHGLLHLLDGIINNAVHTHINALLCSGVGSGAVRTNVKANNDRAGSGSQHNVRLVDGANGTVNNAHANLFVGQLLERGTNRLDRALNVCLDDDIQLLHLALLDGIEQVIERYLVEQLVALFLLLVLALLNQLTSHLLVIYGVKDVACTRNLSQTDDLDRNGRACGLNLLAVVVGHCANAADRGTRDNGIACMQGAVLYQKGCNRTAALIQLCLDNSTVCLTVRVCLEVSHFSGQQYHFEQVVDALTELCGDVADDGLTAPLLRYQFVLGELLEHTIRVCTLLVDLIYGNDDRHVCCLGVVDRLDGLRHNAVIGCYDQNGDIGYLRTACTHGGKRSVTRGIEEGDRLAANLNAVCADVLGNAAGLALDDLGLADRVEQRGLAVVNVTHNNNDRIARLQFLFLVLVLIEQLLLDGNVYFLLNLAAHFLCNDGCGIVVDHLGDGRHNAQLDETLDNIRCGALHTGSQLTDGNLLRNHYLYRNLLKCCHLLLTLQAAHLLLLLLTALVAERLGALVRLLGQLLLLAALGLHSLGLCVNQLIYMIIIFCKVYVAGAAGINAVNLLYLALCRLLLHDRLLSLGLGLLFGFRLGLLRLLAGCTLCVQRTFHVAYLIMLGEILENDRQVGIVKHLHVILRCRAILRQNFSDLLGGYAEVLCNLVYPIFIV